MPTTTALIWRECPPIEVRGMYYRAIEAELAGGVRFLVLWDGLRATAWRDVNGQRTYLGYGSSVLAARYICELAARR